TSQNQGIKRKAPPTSQEKSSGSSSSKSGGGLGGLVTYAGSDDDDDDEEDEDEYQTEQIKRQNETKNQGSYINHNSIKVQEISSSTKRLKTSDQSSIHKQLGNQLNDENINNIVDDEDDQLESSQLPSDFFDSPSASSMKTTQVSLENNDINNNNNKN